MDPDDDRAGRVDHVDPAFRIKGRTATAAERSMKSSVRMCQGMPDVGSAKAIALDQATGLVHEM